MLNIMYFKDIIKDSSILDKYKYKECITLICSNCNIKYKSTKKRIYSHLKSNHKNSFCSSLCVKMFKDKQFRTILTCKQCNNAVSRRKIELIKHKNAFCSSSCSAKYNNTHKTKGNKRSKLEIWLEKQLSKLYSNLEIKYNQKSDIDSELDIYIPSLKLAFELNGIFHYEPIFGKDKLNSIKNNDQRKFQACLEKNIELCIIDVSKMTNFKESKAIIFLEIITNIINLKI